MPAIVNLEGSEEDFARLLVFHRIINKEQLQRSLEDRQSHAAKGGSLEPLRDTLLRLKIVASSLIFDVLRTASKVVETCTKCTAAHHIYYYHPHSRYFCTYCKGPLRVSDPGQSMKWQPGELMASVKELHAGFEIEPAEFAPAAPPAAPLAKIKEPANPLDDPSAAALPVVRPPQKSATVPPPQESPDRSVTILPGGDETMLDLGSTPRVPSRPAASAPSAKPFELPKDKPAAAPPPAAPAKTGSGGLPSWMDQDESMLDLGVTPRSSSKPPAPPKLPEAQEKPPAEPAPPERSVTMAPGGGETMLGMGDTPRSSSKPPALPKLPKIESKPSAEPASVERSVTMTPGGGETMLGMGDTPRSASKPPAAAPASQEEERIAVDPTKTIVPVPGAGETMLDLGPMAGHTPPKGKIGDMTTSIFGGSRKPLPAGLPKTPPETPVLPSSDSNANLDVTTRQGSKTDPTLKVSPNASTESSTVDKTQMQTTPKTAGGSAAIANARALPGEVAQAAKDPNRIFGKYVLMNELGRGGAGVVYKAWDTLLLQYVALKFIRNQDDGDSDSTSGSSQIEEFQREARMSVRLRHPNIVRIFELGSMSNRYYLSMEYIEGGTLLAMIHGGKERNQKTRFNSDPLKFLKIMQNIALAVDYAHNTKPPIIHRDLKPHNVLVDLRGNPYVVDFGLAKEVDTGEGATLTGVVKGTPTYMAPEQAEGRNRDVDPRTDVYSLGAILYEMLTGRPPFLGESVPEILRKIATELPERPNDVITATAIAEAASTTRNSKTKTKPLLVPKPLETICLKAIEKGKPDRYQSAKEFAEDLDRYLKDEDILAQEPGLWRRIRRKIRQRPIVSAAIAAVMLAAITGFVVSRVNKGSDDVSTKVFIQGVVERGDAALKIGDWAKLGGAVDDLQRQDAAHPKIAEYRKALKDHEELVEKTKRQWSLELDRVRREPLSQVLGGLREKYKRFPELQPKLRESLTMELDALKRRVIEEARRLVGGGARPAWVEEIIKQSAKDAKEQAEMLIGLAKDPDFKYPTESTLEEAREGLGRVIAYQGTWTLQVNVAPYAEVTVSRAERELPSDFTPLGLQDLEVVGSSYFVELCWPTRQNAKVKMTEEIKELRHGQTVVIRGDLSKSAVKQERK